MPEIRRDRFDAYEQIILSGQIPQEDVPKFMNDNPEFAAWYRARINSTQRSR